MAKSLRLFILVLLVCLLALWQSFDFSIFNVKPNLALAAVIAISFFIADIWQGFLLVVLAALILKFAAGPAWEILLFSLIGAAAVIVKKYLPWHNFLSNLFLIGAGTFIFYFFSAYKLILSVIFVKELIFNLVLGALIFAFLNAIWQNEE